MPADPDKHNLYLSRQVWGALKARAFQERASASQIITFLLAEAGREESLPALPRYQPRVPDQAGARREGRSVYVPGPVWQRALEIARRERFSITGLVEHLLRAYLALEPAEKGPPAYEVPGEEWRYIRVGEKVIDLGENPRKIDLKTGEPLDPGDPSS